MKRVGVALLALVLVMGMIPVKADALELDVAGKAAVLMDLATGTVLYEQNPHERLAPASVSAMSMASSSVSCSFTVAVQDSSSLSSFTGSLPSPLMPLVVPVLPLPV